MQCVNCPIALHMQLSIYSGLEDNTGEVKRLLFNAIFFKALEMNYETFL